ncbi:MAG TPA: DUF3859 domain-containing protein [Burkholderiales bacterium]|nr:DUF3859 domain-containing protein [Burkholderiales bacterium]
MRKQIVLAGALLAIATAAAAHHGRLQEHLLKVDVTSAGRFAAGGEGFVRTAGQAPVRGTAALLEATDRVPLRIGERFGFCFEVSGFLEDGEGELQKIVTHPAVAVGGARVEGFVQEIALDVTGGKASACIGHTLATAQDLIPGRWTIALGAGETTLAERAFILE